MSEIKVVPYIPDEDYDNPAMVVDFYEFTMANCLFLNGFKNTTLVFDMFFRKNPDNQGYSISAGQRKLTRFLLNYHFNEQDVHWLRTKGMSEEFCEYLRTYRWKGDMYALPEGTVCYPHVQMVRIECDLVGAILIETYLLQTMNFHSLIATKATRITGLNTHTPRSVMEFGTRRAQGESAGNDGAYAAVLGGCIGTANCLAEMKFGSEVKAVGTVAHSFIEFFPTEFDAFKAFADTYPDSVSLLLDTYNIMESGLPNLIKLDDYLIEKYPNDPNRRVKSARIDSGDLARGSKRLRKALDALPEGLLIVPAAQISTVSRPEVETDDAFLRKLRSGKKVIAVELDSPKDADLTAYLEGARRLQAAGTDLMTVADCPIARARMDSSLVACRVHRELGLPTLPHMTCRDRNLNATKALLLGLYAEGVREVLAITGDPIPSAERDEVKSVYQFNSRKLAQYIVSLAGEGREMPSPLTVFGALNLNARNFDVELRRAVEKLENGMTGFLTQPVLSEQAVQNLQQARQTLGPEAKILAGILPVVSQRNAIFMENEVNGIHVDAAIIDRFAGLDRAAGEELGIKISVQAAKAALPYADGFYLMTPFNRVALMERLIARLKEEVIKD